MEYLNVVIIGDKGTHLIGFLTDFVAKYDCNIARSRITALGKNYVLAALISGNWNAVAKLETLLMTFEVEYGLNVSLRRTALMPQMDTALSYEMRAIGVENAHVVAELTRFFTGQGIVIEDFFLETFKNRIGTVLFSLNLMLTLPATINIVHLRDAFAGFCETFNVDATLEPEKIY